MKRVFEGWVPKGETPQQTIDEADLINAIESALYPSEEDCEGFDEKFEAKKRRITIIVEDVE